LINTILKLLMKKGALIFKAPFFSGASGCPQATALAKIDIGSGAE
jgi:hypothetical protein